MRSSNRDANSRVACLCVVCALAVVGCSSSNDDDLFAGGAGGSAGAGTGGAAGGGAAGSKGGAGGGGGSTTSGSGGVSGAAAGGAAGGGSGGKATGGGAGAGGTGGAGGSAAGSAGSAGATGGSSGGGGTSGKGGTGGAGQSGGGQAGAGQGGQAGAGQAGAGQAGQGGQAGAGQGGAGQAGAGQGGQAGAGQGGAGQAGAGAGQGGAGQAGAGQAGAGAGQGGQAGAGQAGAGAGGGAGGAGTGGAAGGPGCGPCQALHIPDGGGAVIAGSAAVMPTGDACYEAWVNLDASKSSPAILAATTTGGTYNAVITVRDDQGLIHFGVSNGGPGLTTSFAVNPHDGTWHHVAGCREITGANVTLTLFWDGQLVDTVAGTTSQIGPASDLRLGSLSYATTDGLGGYIDEVRVSSTLRYTGSFTPAPRLQNDSSTALLLHFDSVSGGTFADDSSNALTGTTLGSAAPASICPVCGDSCGACSSLSIPVGGGAVVNGSAAVMPSGDACYEAWVNLDKSKSSPAILAATTAGNTYDALIGVRDDQGLVHFAVQNGGPLLATSHAVDPHDGTWHHVAGCREITGTTVTLTLFWDGLLVDTVAGTTSQIGPASDLRLGSVSYATTDGLGGHIDEVRVSSTVRYTGSFAPAPQCFAPDAATAVLLHFDASSGVFADASANALTVSTLGTAAQAPVCP